MSRRRILRCAGCTRRIRDHHPHISVEDLETGKEITYHARCAEDGALVSVIRPERGKVYALHLHHACPDERPSFGCSQGCFDGPCFAAVGN
jgi:hypothetical protein